MAQPERQIPHTITVAGLKKSGKTTVVEALLAGLRSRGYRVGSMKTVEHDGIFMDHAGTDTYRHAEAGAEVVVALLKGETVRFERSPSPRSLGQVLGLFPAETQYLVCEGTPDPAAPQLVVLCLRSMAEWEETIAVRGLAGAVIVAISGVAADSNEHTEEKGIPVFNVQDARQRHALVDLLVHTFGRRSASEGAWPGLK
jgi:molybdopterin-guanine dinucleotide biosynthesis adapter protein